MKTFEEIFRNKEETDLANGILGYTSKSPLDCPNEVLPIRSIVFRYARYYSEQDVRRIVLTLIEEGYLNFVNSSPNEFNAYDNVRLSDVSTSNKQKM